MSDNSTHTLWVEKYRPDTLEGYIGNTKMKEKMARFIADGDLPHLLFSGPPGTGKTTIAKILYKSIDCDYLYLNASDENNVETVRNKIKNFSMAGSFKKIKIVVLDEADFVTPQAQAALRNLMEACSRITRFILTCNYVERLIEPVVSRTQQFHIEPPSSKEVAVHVAGILTKENVKYNAKDVKLIVDAYFPDVRKIVNELQLNTVDGELKLDEAQIIDSDFKLQVIETLVSNIDLKKKFADIRQTVANSGVRDFSGMYRLLFDRIDEYGKGHITAVMKAIGEGLVTDSQVIDKEINFMTTVINILEAMA